MYTINNKPASPSKLTQSPSKFKGSYALLKTKGMFNEIDMYEPNNADRAYSVDDEYSYKPMTAKTNMSVNPSQSSTRYEQKWTNVENNDLITTFKTI